MKVTVRVSNIDETSNVDIHITGYGHVYFKLEKFPHHCGASILHHFSIAKNEKPEIDEAAALPEVTKYLLNNRREEWNFKRSRIIAGDNLQGFISKLTYYSPEWKESNSVINSQTNKPITFYWLDRNK